MIIRDFDIKRGKGTAANKLLKEKIGMSHEQTKRFLEERVFPHGVSLGDEDRIDNVSMQVPKSDDYDTENGFFDAVQRYLNFKNLAIDPKRQNKDEGKQLQKLSEIDWRKAKSNENLLENGTVVSGRSRSSSEKCKITDIDAFSKEGYPATLKSKSGNGGGQTWGIHAVFTPWIANSPSLNSNKYSFMIVDVDGYKFDYADFQKKAIEEGKACIVISSDELVSLKKSDMDYHEILYRKL